MVGVTVSLVALGCAGGLVSVRVRLYRGSGSQCRTREFLVLVSRCRSRLLRSAFVSNEDSRQTSELYPTLVWSEYRQHRSTSTQPGGSISADLARSSPNGGEGVPSLFHRRAAVLRGPSTATQTQRQVCRQAVGTVCCIYIATRCLAEDFNADLARAERGSTFVACACRGTFATRLPCSWLAVAPWPASKLIR